MGTRYLISRYLSSCKSGAKLGADCDLGMGGATPNRAQSQDGQPPLLTICQPSDKATSGVQAANLVRSRWRGGQRQNWKQNCLQHGCGEVWAVIDAYGSPQGPDTALPKLTLQQDGVVTGRPCSGGRCNRPQVLSHKSLPELLTCSALMPSSPVILA